MLATRPTRCRRPTTLGDSTGSSLAHMVTGYCTEGTVPTGSPCTHRVRTKQSSSHHITSHPLYSYHRLLMFSYLNGYTRDQRSKRWFLHHSLAPQCSSFSLPTESFLFIAYHLLYSMFICGLNVE